MKKFNSIVIIDDDEASQFVCEKIIHFLDITEKIFCFNNGEAALGFFQKHCIQDKQACPELIFLDLDMPVMDGFEFIKVFNKLKIEKDNVKIAILATTSPYSNKVASSRNLGLKYYISKPLDVNKMRDFCEQLSSSNTQQFSFF